MPQEEKSKGKVDVEEKKNEKLYKFDFVKALEEIAAMSPDERKAATLRHWGEERLEPFDPVDVHGLLYGSDSDWSDLGTPPSQQQPAAAAQQQQQQQQECQPQLKLKHAVVASSSEQKAER